MQGGRSITAILRIRFTGRGLVVLSKWAEQKGSSICAKTFATVHEQTPGTRGELKLLFASPLC